METKDKTGFKLQDTSFKLQDTGFKHQVSGLRLRTLKHGLEKMFKVQSSRLAEPNRNPSPLAPHPVRLADICLLFCILLMAGCSRGDIAKSSQVLAQVDGKEITVSYFERQMANLPASVQELMMDGTGKKALLEGLINRELLYKAAQKKKKIHDDVEIRRKLEDLKKELVLNAYIQREVIDKIKVEDKDVQEYFSSNPEEFTNREEIRISQIVVPEQKDADAVLAKLRAGDDFGALAAEYSIDRVTALRKGDVGYFMQKQLPAEVRDNVFRLRVGEVSGPYKMEGGYEIYRITDRRVSSFKFDQVKDALKVQLMNHKAKEMLRALVEDLKKDAKIQMNESFLKQQ